LLWRPVRCPSFARNPVATTNMNAKQTIMTQLEAFYRLLSRLGCSTPTAKTRFRTKSANRRGQRLRGRSAIRRRHRRMPSFFCELLEEDVYVVEHFYVIAEEAYGVNEHSAWPLALRLRIVSSTVGPIHWPPDMPWLWKAKVRRRLRGRLPSRPNWAVSLDWAS